MSGEWRDLVDDFESALNAAIAAKCAVAIGGWYLIPVAAVLAVAMHNAGVIGKGKMGDPLPRQVSLYAGDVSRRYAGYSTIRRHGSYYFRYR